MILKKLLSREQSGKTRDTGCQKERERVSGREHSARLVDWLAGRPARDNAMQWKSSATPYRGLVYTNHRPMEAIILICWPSIEPLSSFRSRIIKVAGRREQTRGRAYTRAFAYERRGIADEPRTPIQIFFSEAVVAYRRFFFFSCFSLNVDAASRRRATIGTLSTGEESSRFRTFQCPYVDDA